MFCPSFFAKVKKPMNFTQKRSIVEVVSNNHLESMKIRRVTPTESRTVTAEEALKIVKSGDRVYLHGQAATPKYLISKLTERYQELRNVEFIHTHIETDGDGYTKPEFAKSFRTNSFFLSQQTRDAVNQGRGDFIPIFLSEIPKLLRENILPVNVALIQVSPPDRHGFCSFGPSVCEARAAVEVADVIVAQVNKHMPRTFGDGVLHQSMIDYLVEHDQPLFNYPRAALSTEEIQIGQNIADLVEDGSTLQMGIGKIPDAALQAMGDRKDLGIHTEMFSDGVVDLVKKGVITGSFFFFLMMIFIWF